MAQLKIYILRCASIAPYVISFEQWCSDRLKEGHLIIERHRLISRATQSKRLGHRQHGVAVSLLPIGHRQDVIKAVGQQCHCCLGIPESTPVDWMQQVTGNLEFLLQDPQCLAGVDGRST